MPYEYSPNAIYSEAAYRESVRNSSGPDTPQMDPYTTQIVNRLNDAEKMVAVLEQQIGNIVDKLLGASPLLAKPESNQKTPEPQGAIEHIVRQTNFLNRRLENLSDLAARLQVL